MPRWVAAILESSAVSLIARIVFTFMFWISGLTKIVDWNGGLADMAHFHLNPPGAFNAATLVVQLVGSALVIWGPYAWLGAGMLGVFTALTIPIAHPFWTLTGMAATQEWYTVMEHVTVIGALILVARLRMKERA